MRPFALPTSSSPVRFASSASRVTHVSVGVKCSVSMWRTPARNRRNRTCTGKGDEGDEAIDCDAAFSGQSSCWCRLPEFYCSACSSTTHSRARCAHRMGSLSCELSRSKGRVGHCRAAYLQMLEALGDKLEDLGLPRLPPCAPSELSAASTAVPVAWASTCSALIAAVRDTHVARWASNLSRGLSCAPSMFVIPPARLQHHVLKAPWLRCLYVCTYVCVCL
jgi:hypothetical protein